MKLRNLFASLALVLGLALSSAQATIIVNDDFESYADTGAMQAVWGASGVGTLATAVGNPGQSMRQNGGVQNQQSIAPLIPTAANPIVFSVDIYDDGTSANKRMTAGLRPASAVANFFELGMYNGPSHYAARVLSGPGWFPFSGMVNDAGQPMANAPVAGWHTFKLVTDGTTATITLDLNGDGNINGSAVVAAPFNVASPLERVRLGLGLSSAGGGVNFDNVYLAQIPEPASLALVGLMGLGLACVRTRR